MITDYLVELGLDAVKDNIHSSYDKQILRERLETFIEKKQKENLHCSIEEELDFGGLSKYIQKELINDVQMRLFGTKTDRGIARATILAKSASYSQAHTSLTNKRTNQLVGAAIDIIYDFYKRRVNRELKFIAAQIEDTVTETTSMQTNELVHSIESSEHRIIEDLGKKILNNGSLSLANNIQCMKNGSVEQVESILSYHMNALASTHELFPDYIYELRGKKKQFYSKPLTQEALLKYPPKIMCTGNIQINDKFIHKFDANTIDYANRHQLPITLNVIAARKFLGDISDPVQHEAEALIGKSITIKPKPFPPSFPCSISLDGNVLFDYILFRTEEILDDNTIVFSNYEQTNSPYRIRMTANINTLSTTYTINAVDPTNKELLQFLKFMKLASLGATISIKLLSIGEVLAEGKTGNLDYKSGFESLDDEVDFLEKVVTIENFINESLNLPSEIMMDDFQTLSYAASLIRGDKCTGKWSKLDFSLPLTESLKQKLIESDNTEFTLSYVGNITINIYDKIFDISAIRTFESVKYNNLDRLKQKATVLDIDDEIKISFLPGKNETWHDIVNPNNAS